MYLQTWLELRCENEQVKGCRLHWTCCAYYWEELFPWQGSFCWCCPVSPVLFCQLTLWNRLTYPTRSGQSRACLPLEKSMWISPLLMENWHYTCTHCRHAMSLNAIRNLEEQGWHLELAMSGTGWRATLIKLLTGCIDSWHGSRKRWKRQYCNFKAFWII